MTVRPTYLPPGAGAEQAGTLILRDGARHPLWRVLPEDVRRVERFLASLSEGEREEATRSLRAGGPGPDGAAGADRGADAQDATAAETEPETPPSAPDLTSFVRELHERGTGQAFLVEETGGGDGLVAFGAYRITGDAEATMTLAVAPEQRRVGLGLLLLDRLAHLAAQHGVERLTGTAAAGNEPLVELFRESGFEVEERRSGDLITLVTDIRKLSPEAARPDQIAAGAFAAATLRSFFRPRAVAVAGASRDPASLGHRVFASLLRGGFQGTVYPVNPKADQVLSVRAWPSVRSIGAPVDLVVVAVPAPVVPAVLDDCIEAGVRALVVVTAGYAETGPEGEEAQNAILRRIREAGMRMVGPNCMGLLHSDPEVSLNASFAPHMPPPGVVGFCSQSGALGVAIIALARRMELGLSSFVSVGNKADVAADDLLQYWEEDPGTEVLLFYLESFARPKRFARIARRVGRAKPIVAVKAGRTEAGGRAAGSHTAALAAADVAVDALFRQTGIIRAETLSEMFGIARALTEQPLPRGRRFAIVTNAGGPGILCADALEAAGIQVETLSEGTQERLASFLPAEAATANPVDMIASAGAEGYRRAIEAVLSADEVDGLVVLYTPVGTTGVEEIEESILAGVRAAQEAGHRDKPVYASIVGGEEERLRIVERGADLTIPAFSFPEEIGRVAGKVAGYREWRDSEPGAFPEFEDQDLVEARRICRAALDARGPGWLSVAEARQVLALAGLEIGAGGVAATPDEAARIAEEVGFPVAAKLASLQIVHKTEIGGVRLGLEDADAVRRAFEEIRSRLEAEGRGDQMEGVLIQPIFQGAAEVMMGMSQDPVFGPVLAFGLGGIHVEILRDVAFRVSPLTDREAAEMIREIRGYRLLQGYRGHPAADVEALEDGMLRLSRLAEAVDEIEELDLNPVFAMEPGEGYRIADVRVKVG